MYNGKDGGNDNNSDNMLKGCLHKLRNRGNAYGQIYLNKISLLINIPFLTPSLSIKKIIVMMIFHESDQ